MAGPYDYWLGDISLRGGDIYDKLLRQQQDLQRGNIMPQDLPQYQAFKSMWENMQQGGIQNLLRQASLRGINVAGVPEQLKQQTMGAPLQYGQQLLQQAYNPQAGIQATQMGQQQKQFEDKLKLMYAQLREARKGRKGRESLGKLGLGMQGLGMLGNVGAGVFGALSPNPYLELLKQFLAGSANYGSPTQGAGWEG